VFLMVVGSYPTTLKHRLINADSGRMKGAICGGMLLLAHWCSGAQFASENAIISSLSFERTNDSLTVSWPISPFDFNLLPSSDLTNPNWAGVEAPRFFAEDLARVTVPMRNNQQFFRLMA
jgi:hypothetical protein